MTIGSSIIERRPAVFDGPRADYAGVRLWTVLLLVSFVSGLMCGFSRLLLGGFLILDPSGERALTARFDLFAAVAVYPLFILAAACLERLERANEEIRRREKDVTGRGAMSAQTKR